MVTRNIIIVGWVSFFDEDNDTLDYWLGLASDGINAFSYNNFYSFSNAKIFDERSLIDVWSGISIIEIDGCDPTERIQFYLD